MEYITDLVFNYVMASAFIGWFTAQIIKVVIGLLDKDKRSSLISSYDRDAHSKREFV